MARRTASVQWSAGCGQAFCIQLCKNSDSPRHIAYLAAKERKERKENRISGQLLKRMWHSRPGCVFWGVMTSAWSRRVSSIHGVMPTSSLDMFVGPFRFWVGFVSDKNV
jgi:hypothetical protein